MPAALRQLLKRTYGAVPFKLPLFRALRPLGLPTNVTQHLHFEDIFTVDVAPGARFRIRSFGDIVENDLFWAGFRKSSEGQSLRVWEQLARTSPGAILDIGANTGVFALTARAVNATARIVAFEPVARIARKLLGNVDLNDARIEVVTKAVSDTSGTATINDRAYEIECIRLDDWLGTAPQKVGLVKLDVELHEPAAIRGMLAMLRRDRPAMIIEILNSEIADAVQSQIADLGYDYYKIDEVAGLVPMDGLDPMSGTNRNCLICTAGQFEAAQLSTLLSDKGPDAR